MAKGRRKSNHYDITLIGSSLSNLIIAERFKRRGLKVAIITEDHALGGRYRYFEKDNCFYPQCLSFFPTSEISIADQLKDLENQWLENIELETVERGQVTYDNSRIQEFLGFGENTPETIDVIQTYLGRKSFMQFNLQPSQWIHRFEFSNLGDLFLNQVVTHIEVEDKKITGFTLNGAKKYTTSAMVYGDSLKDLKNILHVDVLGARTIQKLAKAPLWQGIHLFIKHTGQVTDSKDLHILKGNKTEPCLGQFSEQVNVLGETQYYSQWLTFVPADFAEDEELSGQAFREIKKQIKRAYPEALEMTEFERLYIEPVAAMDVTGVITDGKLKAVENLWFTGPGMHPEGFLSGDLLWADHQWLQIVDELQPVSTQLESSAEL